MKPSPKHSLYHSFLRVAVCVFALILVFDSGLLFEETILLSTTTQEHLASVVGVSVGVAPTELNQLTARITELETELEAKERLIAVSVGERETTGVDTSTFVLSTILFILLTLIVLNYVLDFMRTRKPKIRQIYEEQSKSLA